MTLTFGARDDHSALIASMMDGKVLGGMAESSELLSSLVRCTAAVPLSLHQAGNPAGALMGSDDIVND